MSKLFNRVRLTIIAALLCGVALAIVGTSHLWAQQDRAGSASADEAAKLFIVYLTLPELRDSRENALSSLGVDINIRLVSLKSFEQLGRDAVRDVLKELEKKVLLSRWQTQMAPTSRSDSAVVQVTPGNDLKPVVCIREGEYWYVDLVETAKHWFRPGEKAMQRIRYELNDAAPQERISREICQSNLRQVALAMKQYSQDYDEMYAPANKWCEVLPPYAKTERIYHCPAKGKNQYGYAMNWKLSRRNEVEVNFVADTVLFYESSVLRRNQNGDGKDLTFRHAANRVPGAYYAYVDGHVAWARQGAAQNFRLTPPRSPVRRSSRDRPTIVAPPATMTPATTVINKPTP